MTWLQCRWSWRECWLVQANSFIKTPQLCFSFCRFEEDGGMNVSVTEKNMKRWFFCSSVTWSRFFRRMGGGGWRDGTGRINVSVRGSCSANRQQRLHCLQAETRMLIWERCQNWDAERTCSNWRHEIMNDFYILLLKKHQCPCSSRVLMNYQECRSMNRITRVCYSTFIVFPAVTPRSGRSANTVILINISTRQEIINQTGPFHVVCYSFS